MTGPSGVSPASWPFDLRRRRAPSSAPESSPVRAVIAPARGASTRGWVVRVPVRPAGHYYRSVSLRPMACGSQAPRNLREGAVTLSCCSPTMSTFGGSLHISPLAGGAAVHSLITRSKSTRSILSRSRHDLCSVGTVSSHHPNSLLPLFLACTTICCSCAKSMAAGRHCTCRRHPDSTRRKGRP